MLYLLHLHLQFASQPGRFSLSDIQEDNSSEGKSGENNNLSVNILANFDWGANVIETIQLSPISSLGLRNDSFKVSQKSYFLFALTFHFKDIFKITLL